ncbi:uncharacterized protein LOC112904030 [Agrilus planipennis]|uniref:Uncharacterized protein LOC112904030 n=1 Tax=Agrilus planipennis TaxID=224129 RepID=A0A7F5QV10_AGRPL|nr:uncharacterized protein LOC112904030 [Agrilus planipennis]
MFSGSFRSTLMEEVFRDVPVRRGGPVVVTTEDHHLNRVGSVGSGVFWSVRIRTSKSPEPGISGFPGSWVLETSEFESQGLQNIGFLRDPLFWSTWDSNFEVSET